MDDLDPEPLPIHLGMTVEQAERVLIAATLEHTGWKIKKAAEMLGIDRSTVYKKISRYRIARPSRSRPGGSH
jgi:transcriptional regulator of acetoin/glycerol metabolism